MNWTTGPLDPALYWRRRAVVGVPILILLLALATCAVTAGGSDTDTSKTNSARQSKPAPTPAPSSAPASTPATTPPSSPAPSSPSPAVSPTPTQPPGPVECTDNDLSVTVSLAHQKYPTKSKLPVKLSVANTSGKPCIRDVGAEQQEVQVFAGDKRLWSSDDCTDDHSTDKRTLAPNEKLTSWVTWNSTTSAPGCQQSSAAAAGTYQVTGRIGGKTSAPVIVTLT
ncbi:MAG: hypothetical protein ACRDPW_05080 [Mycobacteriales bacterium]